ncbi:hypothetical protein SteCoe_8402 [Stentor coeruleus]|uniref:Uncharacterized protein n=1 Tax=Stentor coeruleus TaxID=5963 RepID=A0A1R2CKB8_9CILI|nr:hypothetical protein SteCoe_8402 [Stentor coeruleus]
MAEFYLQTRSFFELEWKKNYSQAIQKVASCKTHCKMSEECNNKCDKPLQDLKIFIENKETLYVKKGVEYCKSECWEAKDLHACSERCVKDYGILIKDFKSTIEDYYGSLKFYNDI